MARRAAKKASGVEGAEVLSVEPFELGEVEDRAAKGDALEVELVEHLWEREDVALLDVDALGDDLLFGGLGHAAAHEAEEVEQRLGQEAGFAVVDEGDGILALGDFGLVEVAQQGHVPEARQLPAEGLVEQHVLGGGRDPLLGADDVGDLHEVVVDDVGEVIGGEAVGLEQDLVVDVVVGEGDGAAQLVAKGCLSLDGDLEADDRRAAFGLECGDLRGG